MPRTRRTFHSVLVVLGLIVGTAPIAVLAGIVAPAVIAAPAGAQVVESNPPVVTELSLPPATLGQPYSATLIASGGAPPYSWTILTGAIPLGLVLDSTGTLSGIPGAVGTQTVQVRLTDAVGATTTATITLDVLPPPPPIQVVTAVTSGGLVTSATNAGAADVVGAPPVASTLTGALAPASEIGVASDPGGRGSWVLLSTGRVVPVGAVPNYGQLPVRLAKAGLAGIAVDSEGTGYWIVTRAGHVYGFGSARTEGSLTRRGSPVIGIAPGNGAGYLLLQANGVVTGFGTAKTEHSIFLRHLHLGLAGIATTPNRDGYWVVARDGRIFPFYGAKSDPIPGARSQGTITAVASSVTGPGLYLANRLGQIFSYGSAIALSPIPLSPGTRIVGIAASA